MAVQYRGPKPDRNYTTEDFRMYGVTPYWTLRWTDYRGVHMMRSIFRSNGLVGEIRTVYDGTRYAVDVKWGWSTDKNQCLTTECKTVREAKSILFMWFKSKGFRLEDKELDYGCYLSFKTPRYEGRVAV